MKSLNWITITGTAYSNENEVIFNSDKYAQSKIRCNRFFRGGTIEFDVEFIHRQSDIDDNVRPLQLYVGLNYETGVPKLYFGISSDKQYTISQHVTIGNAVNVPRDIREIKPSGKTSQHVKIEIVGSVAKLFIDGVLVRKAENVETTLSQITLSLEGKGNVTIRHFMVAPSNVKAFVIMDFDEKYESVYSEIIKPVCEELDIECIRADEQCYPGPILQDIIASIRECDIIIADITPDNPNVYFEVGYAYALGKNPILLMNKARERLPFDISGFRTIMYSDSIKGAPNLKQQLTKFVKSLLDQ